MKITCSKCGLFLEAHKIGGSQAYCNPCKNEYSRANRTKHSDLLPIQKMKANARSYANAYHNRGKLERKPCESCGYEVTQFHHEDYTKPLEVKHLCKDCHVDLHKKVNIYKALEVQN